MCGASLVEEEPAVEEEARRGLPGWASALIVTVLALAILAAGGFGLYALLTAEPEPVPPTLTPTNTPTATPFPTPTRTPTITPIPTPIPPLVHKVQELETLIDIAAAHGTTVEAILALNPDVEPDLLQVGQLLLIPAATPTPGPTSTLEPGTPTPTPGDFTVHVVSSGETLITIAEQYPGVSVDAIRVANDLPPGDDTIRVNESLVIPMSTPVPSPTPTIDPNATSTPVPPYQPPSLLSPPDGVVFVGSDESILLQWTSVSVLSDDEWYMLTLLQPPGGVVSATTYTRATAWRVPLDLLPPEDAAVREFRWQVQAVRETRDRGGELIYEEAGGPSEVRTFTWLVPTPTPRPTPTPAP